MESVGSWTSTSPCREVERNIEVMALIKLTTVRFTELSYHQKMYTHNDVTEIRLTKNHEQKCEEGWEMQEEKHMKGLDM